MKLFRLEKRYVCIDIYGGRNYSDKCRCEEFCRNSENLQIIKSYLSPYIDVCYELFEFLERDIKVLRILVYYICIITC